MIKNQVFIYFFLCCHLGYGQSWTPKDAYWIYDASFMFARGDIRLSYLKDTIVQNENCQIMGLDMIVHSYLDNKYRYINYGNEITYYKSGVTYIFNGNSFDTLYFFSANINDKYTIASKLSFAGDKCIATVIDTGQVVINSVNLKWLAVDYNFKRQGSVFNLRDTIIEKIGSTKFYYLPWDFINGIVDGNRGGILKCYHDNVLGVHLNGNAFDCTFDLTLGDDSYYKLNDIHIFPNPADNTLFINKNDFQTEMQMVIYSSTGHIIDTLHLEKETHIDTTNWKEGFYILVFHNKLSTFRKKIVITH